MRLNRRKLRRLIEAEIYEQGDKNMAAKIDFKDKKQLVAAAGALHSAMFGGFIGLGTDEKSIKMIFTALGGNKARLTAVESEYKRIFQSDLMEDLRSEMGSKEIMDHIESVFPGAMS